MKTHYQTLGIDQAANDNEIKKAYFDLAKKYHPDSGDDDQVKHFHELVEAHKILSDKDLRQAYDATLKKGLEKINEAEETFSKMGFSKKQGERESYRDDELKVFHKNRFRKAIFRVVASSLLAICVGASFSILVEGKWLMGALSGLFIGLNRSLRKNFEITVVIQKQFNLLLWCLFGVGMVYFASFIFKLF